MIAATFQGYSQRVTLNEGELMFKEQNVRVDQLFFFGELCFKMQSYRDAMQIFSFC